MTQAPPLRKFAGFVPPEKNYFHMPNEWIDICAEIDNLAEIKVIQYVLRHTWGYQEYGIAKAITVDEFMYGRKRTDGRRMDKGTGLKSDRSVKDGIKDAIEHGYLICEIDATDKARIKKSYAVKMLPEQLREGYNLPPDARQVVSTPLTGSIYPSEVQNLPLRDIVSTPRSEKDTIERHYKKDTKETHEREVAHATALSLPLSPIHTFEDRLAKTVADLFTSPGIRVRVVSGKKHYVGTISPDDETEKRRAIKPSQKEGAHVQNQTHSGNPGNSSQPHLDTGRNSIPLDASLDSHEVKQPSSPRKPPTNPVPRRPKQQGLMDELPSTPASKPVEPVADMTWGTRKCLQWFDYWRGGTLIAKWKLQQAANCAKGLAEQFDEQTVVEVYGDMAADQYYIERGGPDICDVANNIHKYLNKKKPKKEPSNEHKAVQHANAFIARGYDKEYNKRKLEEMRAENERRRQAQAAGGMH